jgi:two-component system, OmpR family, KDP operon response regulator KdpE
VSKILVVDDELPLLRALGVHLRARGYDVDLAETGEAAIARGATGNHDAAIVDLGLPGLDGIEVVKGLRGWTSIPIIVLSARQDHAQKVLALDAGADDYVTKPFNMEELLARLRAALRRATPDAQPVAMVATPHFRIDLVNKRVTDARGGEIGLTPTQWHLVEILVRNPDRMVSQRQLLEDVWGPTYVDQTNYLRQFMAQLRRKLEPDPARPRYFVTEPGMGVRFVPARSTEDVTPLASNRRENWPHGVKSA